MATDCVDGGYLDTYARFFAEFVVRVNPDDQLPVKVSAYDVSEGEIVGEIISVTLQYLNQIYCPPSLQSYIIHLVIQAIKSTCKKQPEICGLRQQEKTYAPLKLMQAITNEVNEICRRYLRNSSLALLPPPSSTPQVVVGATRNGRRRMEDRHVVLHDLHTIFNIQDDTVANYYAVFDGHGGQDAAAYCATHLHQYLAESVHYPTDPERALRDAFLTTDAQFIEKSNTRKLNGGTTAVCILILDKKLYVAWVGDSMASLVKRDCVKQLVNPHRPTRKDEEERILNMGGVIMNCVGVMRVNGFLSISRAIGDVSHKPYVTGEPEIRCFSLDGTEDFLIIACDGLWDHVDQKTAAQRVYRQVLQNPHDLKYVHQTLLQSAKCAGSLDNITVIVVFLTPPIEIASRPLNAYPLLSHPTPNGLLNNMDPNNPFLSNVNGQFDVNAAFVKQQKHDADLQHENGTGLDPDDNRLIYGTTSSNGKHEEDADGNDDYDYGDLGPETDVDAVDDVPDVRAPLDRLSRELFTDEKSRRITGKEDSNEDDDDDDDDDDEDEDDFRRDNVNVRPYDSDVMDNRIRGQSDEDVYGVDNNIPRDNDDALRTVDSDVRVEHVEPDAPVDDDESPPSPLPRATKPLQHALIPEADNVADSEDSEDEWNYYRIDPNKEESTAVVARSDEKKKNIGEKDSSEEQSPEDEGVIKCEKREGQISSELTDTDISADRELSDKLEKDIICEEGEKFKQEIDMDFQLNPNAAEFVPTAVSPTLLDRKNIADYPISGSPLKQTALMMDDITVPSQREFEEEVCQRPREVDDKDYTNGDHDNLQDVSEISSTKAELGDESVTRIMATTQQWQADTSQWSVKMRDDVGSESEEYDISKDPMAMSFAPSDFQTAFEKGVDLNAVHDLSGADIEGDENECYVPLNDTPARSPEPYANEDHVRTPLLDDKLNDFLHASSTPYDGKVTYEIASEQGNSETVANEFLNVGAEKQELTMEQLGISPLMDEHPTENEVEKSDPATLPIDEKLAEPVENIAEAAVSNLLDSPNPAESCAKESSPSSMSPVQDTLECTSPEPVEDDVMIPTIEPTAPVESSLQPDVIEFDSAQQYNFDPFVSDLIPSDGPNYVMAACGSSIFKNPVEEVSATIPNIENLNFDLIGPALVDVVSSANLLQDQQCAWDSNAKELPKENIEAASEIFTNFSTQEKTKDHLKSPTLEPELITENADLSEDFARNEELCKLEADKIPLTNDDVDLMKDLNTFNNMLKQEEPTNFDEMKFMQDEKLCEIESEKTVTPILNLDVHPEISTTVPDPLYSPQKLQEAEETQSLLKDALPDTLISIDIPEKSREEIGESVEVVSTNANELASAENTSPNKEESQTKQEPTELLLDSTAKANESKEKPVAETVGIVATAMAAGAAAVATVTSSTKTKTTTTKRPVKNTVTMKTITSTTKPTSITKGPTKSTPTSPSKTVSGASTRTTTTSAQLAAAKKPAAARPKQLDGPTAKAAVSSIVGKTTATKPTTSKTATTSTTKPTVSSRVNSGSTKPKTTATTTILSKSNIGATERSNLKKPTANGDVKSSSRPATAKSTASKTTTTTPTSGTKTTTLVKSSMKTSPAVTSKPRPTSATSTVKAAPTTFSLASSPISASSSRPKTAPISSTTTKMRDSIVRMTTIKSPMIDKQIKETANKQISLGRTGVSSTLSKTGRSSTGTTTNVKSRTSTSRTLNTSVTSPTKKSTPSKVATSKVSAKTTPLNNKAAKPLSNGVTDNTTVPNIITTNDKLVDDDVPRKDASPVDMPTDNQLIVTAD